MWAWIAAGAVVAAGATLCGVAAYLYRWLSRDPDFWDLLDEERS